MNPTRRQVLYGAAGAMLPLPALRSVHAHAAPSSVAHPLVVVRAASGVAQADGEEPEQFWPRSLGPLSREGLREHDSDRVTSELADFAEHLLLVRGTRFPFAATRELHAGGGNQLLTAARPGPLTSSVMTYAQGESIDSWVAGQSEVNGGEPLTLYAGRRDNYGEEVLSYRGPQQLRGAESDPWKVYQRLTGTQGNAALRTSINDMVFEQLASLQASSRLSRADRERLEHHTDSVRDIEVLSCRLSGELEEAMREVDGQSAVDAMSLEVARLHCDLIGLVLSCDGARAVTLQIGDRLDRCRYEVDGFTLPTYHELTHRLVDPAALGPYRHAYDMHAAVNRLHLGVFRHLLEVLDSYELLERSVAVFTSDVATGTHRYDQIPWILAGAGDGALAQGAYIDAGDVTHDLVLAGLLAATGHRQATGAPVERFGDASLLGGRIDAMWR